MKPANFRQHSLALHSWAGLLVGWVLFFIFVTGTLGYFDTEIDRWMQPELPVQSAPAQQQAKLASDYLQQHAAGANSWYITLSNPRQPNLSVSWRDKPKGKSSQRQQRMLDLTTTPIQPLQARDTAGGQALYRMHYRLHYLPKKLAFWLVGACAMAMLVALITGVLIHKKIVTDFFTFRPKKKLLSWRDLHNLFSVLSLPFHLMITFTGLLFISSTLMKPIIAANYGTEHKQQRQFTQETRGTNFSSRPARQAAELYPLHQLVAEAQQQWGDVPISRISVRYPGDRNARVSIVRQGRGPDDGESLVFDGVSGQLLGSSDSGKPAAAQLRASLLKLHEGTFASPLLRWLYFLSGLTGIGMIGTGLYMWTEKRHKRPNQSTQLGFRLVNALNLTSLIGFPIAIAGYFVANRLLPIELANRPEWELNSLFICWGAMLLHALLRQPQSAWREQLTLAAGLYLGLPLLSLLTTSRNPINSLLQADYAYASVEAGFLLVGTLLLWLARRSGRQRIIPATPRTTTPHHANHSELVEEGS